MRLQQAVAGPSMGRSVFLMADDGAGHSGVSSVFAVRNAPLPPGLGSHVHWDRRLDAQLAAALMGIQAIKGVEVGDGFTLARTRGSAAHDEILPRFHHSG